MGHNPLPPSPGITIDQASYRHARATGTATEGFHLQRAREAFACDLLDLRELERAIEHVLRGGYLDENFVLRAPIMDRVRRRRLQRDCPHASIYVFSAMGEKSREICADCGDVPWDDVRAAWRAPVQRRDRRRRELGAAGSTPR